MDGWWMNPFFFFCSRDVCLSPLDNIRRRNVWYLFDSKFRRGCADRVFLNGNIGLSLLGVRIRDGTLTFVTLFPSQAFTFRLFNFFFFLFFSFWRRRRKWNFQMSVCPKALIFPFCRSQNSHTKKQLRMIKRWTLCLFAPVVLQSHAHFQEAPSQRQEVFSVGCLRPTPR